MKNLFLAIDLQKDFVNSNGALPVPNAESIKPIVKNVIHKIQELIENDPKSTQIWYTEDWHIENDPEFSDNPDFINTFPKHCIEWSVGAEIIDEAKIEDSFTSYGFRKNKFSVFKGNEYFLTYLNETEHIDNIYVLGTAGDKCVKETIEGLLWYKDKDFTFDKLYIIEDAIKSLNSNDFQNYLTQLSLEYNFVKIIKSTQI